MPSKHTLTVELSRQKEKELYSLKPRLKTINTVLPISFLSMLKSLPRQRVRVLTYGTGLAGG